MMRRSIGPGGGKRRKLPWQAGFTLIEALVAMVLVASTGMALFAWINSNLIALNRVKDANAESDATVNAVEYLNAVNPMVTPTGEAALGNYRIAWRARASTEVRDGAGYPYGTSQFQLALYDTRVEVQRASGERWFEFSVQQVGYQRAREPGSPAPPGGTRASPSR